ncbi:MAG: hypothetical protein IH945_04905 [Armatimonadetes bacterium]|nr:hypothetical protein [Armatimonadota bacterium]
MKVKTKIIIAAIAVVLLFAIGSYATPLRYMKTSEVESRLSFGMTREEVFEALSISERGSRRETTRHYDDGAITFVVFGSDFMSAVFPQAEYTLEFVNGRLVAVHANEVHFVEENGGYLNLRGVPDDYSPLWSPGALQIAVENTERRP